MASPHRARNNDLYWHEKTLELLALPDERSRAALLATYSPEIAESLRICLYLKRRQIAAGQLTDDELNRLAQGRSH